MLGTVVVASKNPEKIEEMRRLILEVGLAVGTADDLDWPDVPEEGATLEENALRKAISVAEATGLPAVADDTGLELAALDGAPGVMTARFAGEGATYDENVQMLLEVLEHVPHREAVFRTVVALAFSDGRSVTAEGRLSGEIARTARGVEGFGYDPVFEVEGRTLAEMSSREKDAISHRRRALEALVDRLEENTRG